MGHPLLCCISGGDGWRTFDGDQLGPDSDPIFGAQLLSRDFLAALALNEHAQLRRRFTSARKDLVEVGVCDATSLRKDLTVCGFEVHPDNVAFRYSCVKRFATSKC